MLFFSKLQPQDVTQEPMITLSVDLQLHKQPQKGEESKKGNNLLLPWCILCECGISPPGCLASGINLGRGWQRGG